MRIYALLALLLSLSASAATAPAPWAYDEGPNPNSQMGRELIDLHANIPYMPGLSKELTGGQKFRPAFGPVLWRMRQEKNGTKILFIGQDATHIAEAAGRTATAGFGGRAQDLANYFGVDESAAFINTYAYTIRGQYGAFQTPYVRLNKQGQQEVQFSGFVDNNLWLLSMDPSSPITQWRNGLIDWIMRNNQDSLQLIVLFGGGARDAAAGFVESKGASVGTRLSPEGAKFVQVPETKLEYAGGNNEFPVPLSAEGNDLYREILGRAPDYENVKDQDAARKALQEEAAKWIGKMAFTKGGPLGNGLIHPAQLGGYDLRKMKVNGAETISLRGLKLSDGSVVKNDVLLVQLPHPSALSRMENQEASKAVAQALEVFDPYVSRGWKIPADPGHTNSFAQGQPYRYARAEIGPEYYDFGTPATRMVSVSDASRMSGNAHVIVFGTRDRVRFDDRAIEAMTQAQPSKMPARDEVYVSRSRQAPEKYVFDAGPGEKFARLMKENLPLEKIFEAKPGKNWKNDGIDAYYVKSHPDLADFGHYRGTFQNPRVFVLADPEGYDDLITARALTGTRGQYLQGLMEDLGVEDKYLVLKTVPFGMDGATADEWEQVLSLTNAYREKVIKEVIAQKPELILADGPQAAKEIERILGKKSNIPVVIIKRQLDRKEFGLAEAAEAIAKVPAFSRLRASLRMSDIPRSHLSYYARLWEGTSGDRVLNAADKMKGKAFAEVAPKWAWGQQVELTPAEKGGVRDLLKKLEQHNLPRPGERIQDFLRRRFSFWSSEKRAA